MLSSLELKRERPRVLVVIADVDQSPFDPSELAILDAIPCVAVAIGYHGASKRFRELGTAPTIAVVLCQEASAADWSFVSAVRARFPRARIALASAYGLAPVDMLSAGRSGLDDVWSLRDFGRHLDAARSDTALSGATEALLAGLRQRIPLLARIVGHMLGHPGLPRRVAAVAAALGLSTDNLRDAARPTGFSARHLCTTSAAIVTAIRLAQMRHREPIVPSRFGLSTTSQMSHLLKRHLNVRIRDCKGRAEMLSHIAVRFAAGR